MATMHPKPHGRLRRQPSRTRRVLRFVRWLALRLLLVVLFLGWWFVLRIEEQDHWPPPADAITPGGAAAATESFIGRGPATIEDLAIPLAPSTAATVDFHSGGMQFFPDIVSDLSRARSSIHILMFTMTPGVVADDIIEVLIERAASGVEVRMIVDAYGANVTGSSEELFAVLQAAGVEVVVNDIFPIDRDGLLGEATFDPWQDEVGNADHRKMLVIDGHIGWVGGAGFEDHFADGGFHDAYARVTGDVVRQMQLVFLTGFHALGGPLPGGSLAPYFPVPNDAGTIPVSVLHNVPGGFLPGTQAIREVLSGAEQRLDILNPYLTDPGMQDLVVEAGERGVDVTIIVPGQSNVTQASDALEHHYPRLFDAGVRVEEYETVMHAKVIVADDTVVIGTINLDAWALYRNHEIALMFTDPRVADDARTVLVDDALSRSEPAELPEGFWNRLQDWFWDKLVYFL